MAKHQKHTDEAGGESRTEVEELTNDLKRLRADFENYMRRVDSEKAAVREAGEAGAILKLLPVIDNIERAIAYTPEDLKGNPWADGVANLVKNLEKSLQGLGLERIEATPGTEFDPELHDAIQVDEDAEGEKEVVAEELQPGYRLRGRPIRHAMVKVTRA
jgi:molecular chaperone GrpE